MTTSGVAIGRKISRFVAAAAAEAVAGQGEGGHRAEDGGDERWRAGRSSGDSASESHMPATPQGFFQASRENWFQV